MSSHTAGFSAAESSENSSKVNLLNLVRELGVKYGWTSKGKVRSPAILALLGEGACERSVAFKLSRPDYREPTKFDPVFARKSEFATTFLLDNLKRRLIGAGYKARLSTEVGDAVGTYDVLVLNETPCVVVKGTVPIVRIELKASMGLPMDQLSRYLLSPVPLILTRVILGTAILLRPSELEEFVNLYSQLLADKADRILRSEAYVVPGAGCRNCTDSDCPYRQENHRTDGRLVSMKGSDFAEDMRRFYANLPRVAEESANLVLKVLKEDNGEPS